MHVPNTYKFFYTQQSIPYANTSKLQSFFFLWLKSYIYNIPVGWHKCIKYKKNGQSEHHKFHLNIHNSEIFWYIYKDPHCKKEVWSGAIE